MLYVTREARTREGGQGPSPSAVSCALDALRAAEPLHLPLHGPYLVTYRLRRPLPPPSPFSLAMPAKSAHHQPDIFDATMRKERQSKGQFWTPQWVARAMVRYPLSAGIASLFDPALGAGAFFRASQAVAPLYGIVPQLRGSELHADVLDEARADGLTDADLAGVTIGDFMAYTFAAPAPGIVANPPYLRHHKMGGAKAAIQQMAQAALGTRIDGRAGLHVYFLIKCLANLAPGGRLAFIMPADTCEGVFAPKLWQWITTTFCLESVVTFAPEATPFPGVDTNAVIFFISHRPPQSEITWARWLKSGPSLEAWVAEGFPSHVEHLDTATITRRQLSEAVATGLSRPKPVEELTQPLSAFAKVVRGIATGDNDFFFLTGAQVKAHKLPAKYLVRAVGRTRDVTGAEVTAASLLQLEAKGRPTHLLYLDGTPEAKLPAAVRTYLELGRTQQVDKRTLVATRSIWYKMERREIPPFLFAYLGRTDTRFIRNTAGVLPLTGFLCVYPKDSSAEGQERLYAALNHPATIANLAKVGKSYGDGAIKVEPGSLARLPIPQSVIDEVGLTTPPFTADEDRDVVEHSVTITP